MAPLTHPGYAYALGHIKSKARNRRKVEEVIRLALSNTQPQIPKLATRLQSQPSRWKCLWNSIAV